MSINRRELLIGGMALPLVTACGKAGRELRLSGDDSSIAHRLRTMDFPAPDAYEKQKVLILGGGVAGCTAAYTLEKKGFRDYRLLEMAGEPGGNARSGRNAVSAFPLGAHYLPLPNAAESDLLEFLQDAGALKGWSAQGEPRFRDEFLCHDPEDRVFYEGRWFEGLIAWKALAQHELDDIRAFFHFISGVRHKKGRDGRRLFTIPLDQSSRDPEWLKLDRMTFADFVRGQGWHSPYLAWYLDYCCRDDYGTHWDEVSAWAGIHYFAARDAERGDGATILTWPEGNAWLIRQLMRRSQDRWIGDTLIFRIEKKGSGFIVDGWQSGAGHGAGRRDAGSAGRVEAGGAGRVEAGGAGRVEAGGAGRVDAGGAGRVEAGGAGHSIRAGHVIRWEADALIVALPRFVAQRLLPECAPPPGALSYAPWMVANCTVDRWPQSGGSALAWDNVPFGSASLGYVVATHQNVQRYEGASVLTSYWPLAAQKPNVARTIAGMRQAHDWERMVLADLEHMHPGINRDVRSMDFWLWGHGMIQPRPGYIWGAVRARMRDEPSSNLAFAHSDMSGISIFEEAFARGRNAALHILQKRNHHS